MGAPPPLAQKPLSPSAYSRVTIARALPQSSGEPAPQAGGGCPTSSIFAPTRRAQPFRRTGHGTSVSRALWLRSGTPHGVWLPALAPLPFNFFVKLKSSEEARGVAQSALADSFGSFNFRIKLNWGVPRALDCLPPWGHQGAQSALMKSCSSQSALTINSTTSSLFYYTIQTQFLLATKSAAVITRACSGTRGETVSASEVPVNGERE